MVEQISLPDFHAALKGQGVSEREHYAFKCPRCSAVQSIASMVNAGQSPADAEKYIGFSCIGRLSKDEGCDWSLGGLFKIHTLEVIDEAGKAHPMFRCASPDEAQELERRNTAQERVDA